MGAMTTKQRIANEALTLFSQRGYTAVSVRDISNAVGIKESSLYNHFKNKQDIFDSIVKECTILAQNYFESIDISNTFEGSIGNYITMSDEEFLSISIGIFQFYLQEENLVKFRRMLTIEQFNNQKIAELFRAVFIDNTLNFQQRVFKMLIKNNIFIDTDPYILALQFYAPVFLMFYKFDELTDEASDILIKHVIQFKNTYTRKQG